MYSTSTSETKSSVCFQHVVCVSVGIFFINISYKHMRDLCVNQRFFEYRSTLIKSNVGEESETIIENDAHKIIEDIKQIDGEIVGSPGGVHTVNNGTTS